MGRYVEQRWSADLGAYGGRRSRQALRFEAYVPDPIAELDLDLPSDVVEVVVEADRAVAALNVEGAAMGGYAALARQLLRAESIASSKIEGFELSHRRLAEAAFGASHRPDRTAHEVLGNMRAMDEAIELGASSAELTVGRLCALHETLMRDAHPQIAGLIRETQNWIGRGDTPRHADYVPPPPELVHELLDDLCAFASRDDLPAIVQAALAHSQFELIHPFADGNGRVGRCLIHVILERRGLAPRLLPPISLILATDVGAYIGGLTANREGEVSEWIAIFALATRTAATEACRLGESVSALQQRWSERAGSPRQGSTARKLIELLPAYPVVDTATVVTLTGSSRMGAGRALSRLEEAGVLTPLDRRKTSRVWEARELFDLANEFERSLTGVRGERTQPVRPAPYPPVDRFPDDT